MVNKSKAIGTRGETAIVNVLRERGFSGAERRALGGAGFGEDRGDILICPGVIGECKWGKQARQASLADIAWMWRQTERERMNAGAVLGLLIVQRNGYGDARADKSRCFLDIGALWGRDHQRVEMVLDEAIELLRHEGWGDPIG